MSRWRLQTRFILAGCLLVAATIGSSLASIWTFAQITETTDDAVRSSQEMIDLSAAIHSSLEREDDALLLFLSGPVDVARQELAAERQRGDQALEKLLHRLATDSTDPENLAVRLQHGISAYRAAGDALLATTDRNGGLETYHRLVNPRLREAVAQCDFLREKNFRRMQEAGIVARDQAARGTRGVVAIAAASVVVGIGVAVWLARAVLRPIRELTESVEAIRCGDFDRRVTRASQDELGQLAMGFNRMAEALAEYRQSSLGELLAAKMTLEATLNALPDAVMVFGPGGTVAAYNAPAGELLAACGAAAAERLADIPLPREYRAAIETALAGRIPPAHSFDFTRTFSVVLRGQPRRLLLTAVPVPQFAPGQYGAVAVFDDVTEFARLDELRSELIGMASHELNSPLTALRMNLLMLDECSRPLTGRPRELLEAAIAGCEELGRTVEELLDVSRIEAGQLRLNRTWVDLTTVLAGVIKTLQTRFDDAGVQLVVTTPPSSSSLGVWGDSARLANVLANILGNALKYSPTGGTVQVSLGAGQNAGRADAPVVQIAVTDEGPGVPEPFRERIFEKFFRVEHHLGFRGKDVRGAGIGLYLCREIIHSHGGTICCEPGPGGIGTRFVISLPVDR
ncbi:MAG: ATP-binding protein [Gemmataceae bacterium]|nr:ATP-binding protein [Gemmata sp.]MDW8197623.1 ATP-binding protein [Gemmataceae bacterium]